MRNVRLAPISSLKWRGARCRRGANFVAKVVVASSQATPLRSKGFDIARYSVGSSGFDAQLALTPSTQRYLTLKLHTQRTAEAVARSAWRAAAGSVRWPQV